MSDNSIRIELAGEAIAPVLDSLSRTASVLDKILEDIQSNQASLDRLIDLIEGEYDDCKDGS